MNEDRYEQWREKTAKEISTWSGYCRGQWRWMWWQNQWPLWFRIPAMTYYALKHIGLLFKSL